jgi:hypothetical protein
MEHLNCKIGDTYVLVEYDDTGRPVGLAYYNNGLSGYIKDDIVHMPDDIASAVIDRHNQYFCQVYADWQSDAAERVTDDIGDRQYEETRIQK